MCVFIPLISHSLLREKCAWGRADGAQCHSWVGKPLPAGAAPGQELKSIPDKKSLCFLFNRLQLGMLGEGASEEENGKGS